MAERGRGKWVVVLGAAWAVCVAAAGCRSQPLVPPADTAFPRELSKVAMPDYLIEPPDILLIDLIRVVPKPPIKIQTLDVLFVQVAGIPKDDDQIEGLVTVDPEGTIKIGRYGSLAVVGKTPAEIQGDLEKLLKMKPFEVLQPRALVSLAQSRAQAQVRGEHLVRPDGKVSLGPYGSVFIAGMTLEAAKAAIEERLNRFLQEPEVVIDVLAYNSKVFYIISDGAGFGDQVVRLPITGNETVLDALSQIGGLPSQASRHQIWIARPAPPKPGCDEPQDQILPVNWQQITQCGRPATNYQLLPGDRLYVKAQPLITLDNTISKLTAPLERLFGVSVLGNSSVRSFKNSGSGNGNNSSGL